MTIGNFLAFIIGLFIGRVLTYLGDKTYKFLNRPKKKLENKEPLIFDGVDDFVKCGSTSNLQIHHLRYIKGKMAWEYKDKDLIVLCETCHEKIHCLDLKKEFYSITK